MTLPGGVFLDRDGVINRAIARDGRPFAPMEPSQFELLPGVERACRALHDLGHVIVVVTNQPEVARGRLRLDDLDEMHRRLRAQLPVADVRFCPHDNDDRCYCRKPKPGMILDACAALGLDPAASVMVGDRHGDIAAGRRAGCATVLIGGGYGEPRRDDAVPDGHADSLYSALPIIQTLLERPR